MKAQDLINRYLEAIKLCEKKIEIDSQIQEKQNQYEEEENEVVKASIKTTMELKKLIRDNIVSEHNSLIEYKRLMTNNEEI